MAEDVGQSPAVTTQQSDNVSQQTDVETVETKEQEPAWAKELKADLAKWKAKAREAEAKNAEFEQAKMSEAEKVALKASEAEARSERLAATLLSKEIQLKAQALNCVDVEVAEKLIDRSKLEQDEEGNYTNVETLLKSILETKPYLQGKEKTVVVAPSSSANPQKPQLPSAHPTQIVLKG